MDREIKKQVLIDNITILDTVEKEVIEKIKELKKLKNEREMWIEIITKLKSEINGDKTS